MRRRLVLTLALAGFLVVAVSIAVAVGRGGGDGGGPSATRPAAAPSTRLTTPSAGQWVSGTKPLLNAQPLFQSANNRCPKPTRSRPRPADVPASFPLPEKIVLTYIRRQKPEGLRPVLYLVGLAPLSLRGAARFFVRELPRGGYYITSSEAERIEVEARFDGPAKGALKVIGLSQCSKAVWMAIGVSKIRR